MDLFFSIVIVFTLSYLLFMCVCSAAGARLPVLHIVNLSTEGTWQPELSLCGMQGPNFLQYVTFSLKCTMFSELTVKPDNCE